MSEGYGSTNPPAIPKDPAALAQWPGAERRAPRRADRHFLVLAPLAVELRRQISSRLGGRTDLRVLDIGCGSKPYLPLLAVKASTYRGLDAEPGPVVDDIGRVEALPYDDASFDVVLCTQVMEHVEDPAQAAAEIGRVLAPGGLALVSTHGVFLFHPDPPEGGQDLWRWTHTGLAKVFRDTGRWSEIEVSPNGEALSCVGYILAQYLDEGLRRVGPEWLRALGVGALNRATSWVDKRYPPRARVPQPGSLSANYLLAAVKNAD